jgi:hypothetical protein
MPEFQTFSAWIMMNEVRLREYDVQEKTDEKGMRVITCWVASEAGKVRRELPNEAPRDTEHLTWALAGVHCSSQRNQEWHPSKFVFDVQN